MGLYVGDEYAPWKPKCDGYKGEYKSWVKVWSGDLAMNFSSKEFFTNAIVMADSQNLNQRLGHTSQTSYIDYVPMVQNIKI